jgi:hypothetical protein
MNGKIMNHDEEIIAEAVRIEYDEKTGKMFLVFEVKSEKYKRDIRNNWADDVEYRLVGTDLVLNER